MEILMQNIRSNIRYMFPRIRLRRHDEQELARKWDKLWRDMVSIKS